MSSSNKTSFLKLNSWISSDRPKFTDFNSDNNKIDDAIKNHVSNTDCHTTADEKQAWNVCTYTGTYFGNSVENRIIKTNCPFEPSVVIVFPQNKYPVIHNISGDYTSCYFGIASRETSSCGISLDYEDRSFMVSNSDLPEIFNDTTALNERGSVYGYVMFK